MILVLPVLSVSLAKVSEVVKVTNRNLRRPQVSKFLSLGLAQQHIFEIDSEIDEL